MESINIRVIIDSVGLIQGLVLGSILIILNRKKEKSSFFLGLFVLAFCLDFFPPLLEYLGLTEKYPRLTYLPLRLSDMLFPLFYLYIQEISILSNSKKNYWVLLPAGLLNTIILMFFLFYDYLRQFLTQYSTYLFYLKVATELFGLAIAIMIIHTVNIHIKTLKNQYTNIAYKTLKWAKVYVIIGIAFTLIIPTLNQFFNDYYYALSVSTLNGILLYWVSIRGIMQNNVTPLIIENEKINTKQVEEKESIKDISEYESFSYKIDELLKSQKLYKRSDLTIMDLADALNVHPKFLSMVINSYFNQNFNTFINNYRVQEAIQYLQNEGFQNLSIEGIGNEVGFKSKSSFYTAFKQLTGTTPSQYKEPSL